MGFPVLASCQCGCKGAKIGISPRAEASHDSAMRGGRLHIYYIYFGLQVHPIGSNRPPWAAGKYKILALWDYKTSTLKSLCFLLFLAANNVLS